MSDSRSLGELERETLSAKQRAYLDAESKSGRVRWDLEPPQREEYDSDVSYMLGLGRYADRCLMAQTAKRGAKS